MTKITADHQCRTAYVYVRQSTMTQVYNNKESQRRQYGLKERAHQLGWQDVVVIDDDLGRSGGGGVERVGFDRLLTAVGRGEVGAVLAIEASRLARNGRDWHTLLEFCAIVGTLIIDEDGVYDPRLGHYQMVLGLKGAFSVMETSAFRQRGFEARLAMAGRGELFGVVAAGYVVSAEGQLRKDPDRRIQEAIGLVFSKFRELGSVRQVMQWLRRENITLPMPLAGTSPRSGQWRLPTYSRIMGILTNPIYAGVYAYGRSCREARLENGRRRFHYKVRRPHEDWRVMLRDHHEGYIDWKEYEHNLKVISNNATRKGQAAQGPVRSGAALLAGLLRCGHCGRKLRVRYGQKRQAAYYACQRPSEEDGMHSPCINIGGRRLEQPVSEEILRILAPVGLEAALAAIESGKDCNRDQHRQAELALEAARYQATLARRQYDAVDPDNRLVAAELERRWNEQLVAVQQMEARLAELAESSENPLSPVEQQRLMELGRDIPAVWNHPAASIEIKKRILRAVIREIVVRIEDSRCHLLIHWQGGDHTSVEAARKLRNCWRITREVDSEEETRALVATLARVMPDHNIAVVLNRLVKRTISGLTWSISRVKAFRYNNGIAQYRDGERLERGDLLLDDVMRELGVCKMSVIRMIHSKRLPAQQVCPGAPYIIRREDMNQLIARRPHPEPGNSPLSENQDQLSLLFQ